MFFHLVSFVLSFFCSAAPFCFATNMTEPVTIHRSSLFLGELTILSISEQFKFRENAATGQRWPINEDSVVELELQFQKDVRQVFELPALRFQAKLPFNRFVVHPVLIDVTNAKETNKMGIFIVDSIWSTLFSSVGIVDPFANAEPLVSADLHDPTLGTQPRFMFKLTDPLSQQKVHYGQGPGGLRSLNSWTLTQHLLPEDIQTKLRAFLSFRTDHIKQQVIEFCLEGRESEMTWPQIAEALQNPDFVEVTAFLDEDRRVPNTQYGLSIIYRMVVKYLKETPENRPFAVKLKSFVMTTEFSSMFSLLSMHVQFNNI